MNEIDNIFFELIRVAIGTQESLSRLPSEAEWEELFEMAVKQSLVGVCFCGIHQLGADSDEGFAQIGMSEELYFDWMGMAAQINMKNDLFNEQCVELQKRLAAEGFRSSILKGQAVAMLYGEELRGFRQSGDIDIYVDCGREKAIEFARSVQGDVDWDYKHLHLNIFDTSTGSATDTAVEMHYVPEVFLNLRKNQKLQKWFKEPEVASSMFFHSAGSGTSLFGEMVCPSVEFNLFYILLHTYRHFLYEGVGMRQLMDYYFVLRASSNVPSSKFQEVARTIESFGMKKFASGVMWIMKEVFGMAEQLLLVEPDEKEGRYILSEVMTGGNFGHHDERLTIGVKGKIGAVMKILRHSVDIGIHYPVDMIWAPINIVHHWCWKRYHMLFKKNESSNKNKS